ncbi:lipopolysaccharide biosynthesis protein [Microlunatus ginsengisoli]|uniref:lipopolysaccharide biosynthesis protein n=1 Tax=Microlunatus ginsengisoli TaxID=363863 RepID=UPI0031DD3BDA
MWSVAQRWAVRIGGLLTIVILARLLTPQDFGLVAVAMAFVPVIYLLADLGFSTYVVQVEKIDARVLSTAFWYAAVAGVVLGAIVLGTAPLIASVFHLPAVAPVLMAIAPTILIVSLSSVPTALLRRRLAFRSLAIQSFVAGGAGQVVAIGMALAGFGVWALVAQLLVNQAVVGTLAWVFSRFRPTWEFSRRQFMEMARFGVNVIAIEFVALARVWAETAIVTAVLGVTGLGYLNIAQRLIQAAQDLSAAAVVPVSTVVFAQVRNAATRLISAYRRAVEITYVLVTPIMVSIAIAAPLIIPMLFGPQWGASVAPSRALAIAGIFTIAASLDNGLFYGTGRPGRWLVYAILVDALTVTTTAATVRFGLVSVSVGFVFVAALATVVRWFLVARLLKTTTSQILKPFIPTACAAAMSGAVGLAVLYATRGIAPLLSLVLVGLAIVLAHLAVVRVLLPEPLKAVVAMMRKRVRRTTGRGWASETTPSEAAPEITV